jgi:hypothetical protein
MIGPKIEHIRVEGPASTEELGGPEPEFVINSVTGMRIYVSPSTFEAGMAGMGEAAKAPASPDSSAGPPRMPTFAELADECRKAASDRAAQAAARAAAGKPKP